MSENAAFRPEPNEIWEEPSGKRTVRSWLVGCGIALLGMSIVIALLLPGIRTARPAAFQAQCMHHLRSITIAVHNYHNTYGTLPPAYTVDSAGKPLHSWRVLILPFLGEKSLYEQIDLTKPWDDPVNERARQTFLPVYRCPNQRDSETKTPYLAIVGEEYAFSPTRPRDLLEISDGDGLTQTVLLIEAPSNKTVEWMSPHDGGAEAFLGLNENSPVLHKRGGSVAFADGHLGHYNLTIPLETRQAFLTISGGEKVEEF